MPTARVTAGKGEASRFQLAKEDTVPKTLIHERKTIAKIERAKNSINGNPSFYITFTDYNRIKTSADCSFCCEVGNPGMREGCEVEVFVNGRGTISGMSAATRA